MSIRRWPNSVASNKMPSRVCDLLWGITMRDVREDEPQSTLIDLHISTTQ